MSTATANPIHHAGAFVLSSYRKIRENGEGRFSVRSILGGLRSTKDRRVPSTFFLPSLSDAAKWAYPLSWPHGTRAPVVMQMR
jgi:hypothetical protein